MLMTEKLSTIHPTLEQQEDAVLFRDKGQKTRKSILFQFLRFSLVGGSNTMIDVLVLNILLWLWPTKNMGLVLLANSVAYTIGALNSFVLNRYWTFRRTGYPQFYEVARFALATVAGIACNDLILWLLSEVPHPGMLSMTIWTNISKMIAIGGTVLISYTVMRLWVFTHYSPIKLAMSSQDDYASGVIAPPQTRDARAPLSTSSETSRTTQSLSVVLPAYNEEQVIATTVQAVLDTLTQQVGDFEVLVVNDGSTDRTGAIVAEISQRDQRVRLITHERNLGYGATLNDGFVATTKELTFFMDSDGQFDIRELEQLLVSITSYDAVIGYRLNRQDTWMRKLNASGWKLVVRLMLGVQVRDIDCAFKLLPTHFLKQDPLESRGAMINAELLYKLKRAGCTYKEVGVHHFPRRGGRATGANLGVIARAFRELFLYTRQWRREERAQA
jgi:putative flippase GtrA